MPPWHGTKRLAAFLVLVLTLASYVHAQIHFGNSFEAEAQIRLKNPFRCSISGKVFATDEFHEKPFPLTGAHVRIYSPEDSAALNTTTATGENGIFYASIWDKQKRENPPMRIIITYVGMDTLDCTVIPEKSKDHLGTAYDVRLDSVVLRSRPITLEETQIIGELKKMYQNKDTTVFNVDAYDMPEGTVLLQLVRRLPGLRYTDGTLTYMGRSIEEMRLNGDTFFKHDISIALENMPNEKLKQVEIYETDKDTLDVTKGKMLVMDMKTKEDVNSVLFARASAATADQKWKYEAGGDLNFFRPDGPQANLSGNLSDMPNPHTAEDKNIDKNIQGFYTQQFGKTNINSLFRHGYTRHVGTSATASNTFLPGNTTADQSSYRTDNRSRNQQAHASMGLHFGEKAHMRNEISFIRRKTDSRTLNSSVSTSDGDTLNTHTGESRSSSESRTLQWNFSLSKRLANDDEIGLTAIADYEKARRVSDNISHTAFHTLGDSTLYVSQRQSQPGEQAGYTATAFYRIDIKGKHTIGLNYSFRYSGNKDRTDCMDMSGTPALTDSLSFASKNRQHQHKLAADLVLHWENARLYATLTLSPTRKSLFTGRRDGLQADKTYKALLHQQNLNFDLDFGEANQITLSYYGEKRMPSDNQLIFIPDYSNPLYIRSGNPDLKNPYTAQTRLQLATLGRNLQIGFNYNVTRNATADRVVYDATTGAKRSMPDNINGNYDLNGNIAYSTLFGDVTWNTTATYRYQHAAQFVQYAGESHTAKNISENQGIEVGISPSYSNSHLMTDLEATYQFDNRSSQSTGQAAYKLHQCRAEWNAILSIGHNWEFETRLDWTYRKGSQIGDTDGNECVWDLGVSYKLLKQKGIIQLKAFDLLRQRKNYRTSFYGNVWQETRQSGETSYISLSFTYRFNNM